LDIENNLHWGLDVIMKADGQLNYVENAAENLNIIRKIALEMIANEETTKSMFTQNEKYCHCCQSTGHQEVGCLNILLDYTLYT